VEHAPDSSILTMVDTRILALRASSSSAQLAKYWQHGSLKHEIPKITEPLLKLCKRSD
jgi:hypothetical protein